MRCSCSARRTTTIADHRQQHLAQAFGLRRFEPTLRHPVGRQTELTQLAQRAGETQRLIAEAFRRAIALDVAAVEQRLNHRRDHDIVVRVQ
jgi:uncharacterized membrane protein